MLLDLITILNNNGAAKEFEGDIAFENLEFSGVNYDFVTPMHIKGKVVNISGSLELTAHVSGKGKTTCARCNKPLDVSFAFDFTEHLANSSDQSDDFDQEKIILTGSVLDVADLALNNFLTQAPMRYLCAPDCKGLCQICGADKNVTSCGCEQKAVDPRLSALDDLFKD